MDPLALLREFNTGRRVKQVAVSGDRINFGDQYSYPKATPTAFRSSRGEHYSLETVLHYLSSKTLSAAEYVKECSKTAILPVQIQDRKVRRRACGRPRLSSGGAARAPLNGARRPNAQRRSALAYTTPARALALALARAAGPAAPATAPCTVPRTTCPTLRSPAMRTHGR
jgi:hypothetical protein